ncbi:MAG: hypothetical protein FJ292_09915 [Planctomycetes bacterium]|nr:hypothetical protein [Planctomycetota bacterium]
MYEKTGRTVPVLVALWRWHTKVPGPAGNTRFAASTGCGRLAGAPGEPALKGVSFHRFTCTCVTLGEVCEV